MRRMSRRVMVGDEVSREGLEGFEEEGGGAGGEGVGGRGLDEDLGGGWWRVEAMVWLGCYDGELGIGESRGSAGEENQIGCGR